VRYHRAIAGKTTDTMETWEEMERSGLIWFRICLIVNSCEYDNENSVAIRGVLFLDTCIPFFYFKFMWPYIVTNFFIIKPIRCTNFTNFILT